MSAHGADALGNAIWKADPDITVKLVKQTLKVMIQSGKLLLTTFLRPLKLRYDSTSFLSSRGFASNLAGLSALVSLSLRQTAA